MPVIEYKEFKTYLQGADRDVLAPVVLVYGEELLCKSVFDLLLEALIPGSDRSFNYEPFDGRDENISDAVERVNTYPFLAGRKVVALCDSRVFYSRQDKESLLERVKEAYGDNQTEKAAKYFVSLLGLLGLSLDEVLAAQDHQDLKLSPDRPENEKMLEKLLNTCSDKQLKVPADQDDAALLQRAIEKGFPKTNHLIITTDIIDKRRRLFKAIQDAGLVIDCSVPQGDRRADKAAQDEVLHEKMQAVLEKNNVKIEKNAYQLMVDMAGFDLRTLLSGLDKLIDYAGDRKTITLKDVTSVLKRTKKEPIYELSNAIAGRNLEAALFSVESLLSENMYPLQILSAMINQIRKLLLVKDFTRGEHGRKWRADVSFARFKSHVLPDLMAHEKSFLDRIALWETSFSSLDSTPGAAAGPKSRQPRTVTDLTLVKNPNNPYPVYQVLKNAENFTEEELFDATARLSRADVMLKSTSHHPKRVLEDVIFAICRQPDQAAKH
ncbi:MAG: hypothetical protein Q8P24_11220 [Desulfobacterales bacterium]|nr:hypothetical protein [Desulfobacterales bacterium]